MAQFPGVSDVLPGRADIGRCRLDADLTPLRGRDPEQALIRELLGTAERGAGGVVLVEGEPGIGKSRLQIAPSPSPPGQQTRSPMRLRFSRCARPCRSHLPGQPPVTTVLTRRARLASWPGYAAAWNSGPRLLRC
jgi:hypothetical protein